MEVCMMQLRLIFISSALVLFLIIPFNNVKAQFKIISSEGTKYIGTNPDAFEKSSKSKTNWTRTYDPGEQGHEEGEKLEPGKKAKEEADLREQSKKIAEDRTKTEIEE
jgi:hypothetical protein